MTMGTIHALGIRSASQNVAVDWRKTSSKNNFLASRAALMSAIATLFLSI